MAESNLLGPSKGSVAPKLPSANVTLSPSNVWPFRPLDPGSSVLPRVHRDTGVPKLK
jgi:hypothetical protein